MKKKLITLIILVEIIIVGIQVANLNRQKKQVLGEIASNSIKSEDVVVSPSGKLKYFHEPKANTLIHDDYIGSGKGYFINLDTLNDRYNYSPEKPDGVYRVIALGDSITYGLHVETRDNWTEVLEDKLNSEMKCPNIKKFEVINLGVWGYDNAYSVERFKIRGQKYNPDLVIWYQAMMQIDEEILKRTDDYMREASKSKEIKREDYQSVRFSYWIRAAEEIHNELGEKYILNYQKNAIESLKQYYSGKLVFVVFPELIDSYKNFLKQIASEDKNYYLIDDTQDYLKENGAVDNTHPNKKGHQMIAEDIFKYISSNKVIPCN